MSQLTADHIDYIRKDLSYRGIIVEGIQEELIDHICSAVEAGMEKIYVLSMRTTKYFAHLVILQACERHSEKLSTQTIKLQEP